MGEFRMPSLGADMEVGIVVEWRVQPGDTVARGDIIAVVETEKSTIEVEVFETGTVESLLVEPGEEVPVGTPLAIIATSTTAEREPSKPAAKPRPTAEGQPPKPAAKPRPTAEGQPPKPTAKPRPTAERKPRKPAAKHQPTGKRTSLAPRAPKTYSPLVRKLAEHDHVDLAAVHGTGNGGAITRNDVEARAHRAPDPGARIKASPLARRQAHDRGIDLATLTGSGPDGAIVAVDLDPGCAGAVVASASAPTSAEPVDRKAKLRGAIGALMSRSKREIPHYYLSTTIDMSNALGFLAERNDERSVSERILPAALLLRAVALACHDVPELNGHWIDDGFHPGDAVHLGVAISLRGGGLVAPAVRDANDLTADELMARLRDLVTRARAGRLRGSEMTDPTITVTNLGDQGVESVFGVIYPPQVALVGFGKIVERPWAVDGMLTVRPLVTATLAADHRVTDGHDGARFLAAVDHHLQEPEQL